MKTRCRLLVVASGLCALLLFGAWYRGFIPCYDGEDRARLRDSLNLWALPPGISIIASGIDDNSNRFYAFDAEFTISPPLAEKLLTGRPFEGAGWTGEPNLIGCSRTIYPYSGFPAMEGYSWRQVPDDVSSGEPTLLCIIYFNSIRSRAFVHFTAE